MNDTPTKTPKKKKNPPVSARTQAVLDLIPETGIDQFELRAEIVTMNRCIGATADGLLKRLERCKVIRLQDDCFYIV